MLSCFLFDFWYLLNVAIAATIHASTFGRRIILEVLTSIPIDTSMKVWADSFPPVDVRVQYCVLSSYHDLHLIF